MIDCSFGSYLLPYSLKLLGIATSHIGLFVRCTVQFSKNHRSSSDLIILPQFGISCQALFLKFFEGRLHRGRRSRGDRYDDTMDGRLCQLGFLSFLLICMERFLRWTRPGAVRVLRFDSASGAEGCGIALAGDEYYNSASRNGKPYNRASPVEMHPYSPTGTST